MITITADPLLLYLVLSLVVLLWSLTWFEARDWNFEGRGLTPVFGSLMVVSAIGVIAAVVCIFALGVETLL